MKKIPLLSSIVISFLFIVGCEDPEVPEHVGKWTRDFINVGLIGSDTNNIYNYRETFVLKETSFENYYEIQYTDAFLPIYKEEGSIELKEDLIYFTVDKFGESSIQNEKVTGNIQTQDITSQPIDSRSYSKMYNLNNNDLTLYNGDINMDGDQEDFGEKSIFRKSY